MCGAKTAAVKTAFVGNPNDPGSGRYHPSIAARDPNDLGPSRHRHSIVARDVQQQRAEAELARRKAERSAWRTGYNPYDELPDVQEEIAKEQYAANHPDVVQLKSPEAIHREIDAAGGVKSWGDGAVGRNLARGFLSTVYLPVTAAGAAVEAGRGLAEDWRHPMNAVRRVGGFLKGQAESYDDTAREMANNWQLQVNNGRGLLSDVWHFGKRYLDPTKYTGTLKAYRRRKSADNEWDNAQERHRQIESRIVDNFRDDDLAHPERSALGMANYGGNAAVGQFASGELLTAGVGGAGKALTAGGKAVLEGAARLPAAARAVELANTVAGKLAPITSRVAPIVDKVRGVRSRLPWWLGGSSPAQASAAAAAQAAHPGFLRSAIEPAVYPAQAASSLWKQVGPRWYQGGASITGTAADALTKFTPMALRGGGRWIADTVGAGVVSPARTAWQFMRDPSVRAAAAASWRARPFRTFGSYAAAPFRWGFNTAVAPTARAAWNSSKAVLGPGGFYRRLILPTLSWQFYKNMGRGKYRNAFDDLVMNGMYSMGLVPGLVGGTVYDAVSNKIHPYPEDEPEPYEGL